MKRIFAAACFVSVFTSAPIGAQETPPHWKWVTDQPSTLVTQGDLPENGWHFVTMPPGWHVTMGPGGILYDPAHGANGRFVVETEIFLFPSESDAGYGLFVGGRDLESDARTYVAFLARPDGAAGLFRVSGSRFEPILDWSRQPALHAAGSDAVRNILRLEAEQDSVRLHVNGSRIAGIARADLPLDGMVGLRIGRAINVHTSNLDLTHRLAPGRQPTK